VDSVEGMQNVKEYDPEGYALDIKKISIALTMKIEKFSGWKKCKKNLQNI
jgi:hypothetical protein